MTNPLLIYIRQSRAKVGETRDSSLSLEQQEEAIRKWAAGNGFHVEQVVIDHDETGRALNRPGIAELKERAREGLTVAVWKYDRFARNLIGQELVVEELHTRGVDVISTTEPGGKLPRQLMGSIAEYYSDQLSERISAIRAAQAARGEFSGSVPAYGYHRETAQAVIDKHGNMRERRVGVIIPNPDTAPIVRELFARYAAGESMYAISRDLHARGVPGPRTHVWDQTMIRRALGNQFYIGVIINNKQPAGIGKYETLVDSETWQVVQDRLARERTIRRENSPCPFTSWLEGIIIHECGARMYLTRIHGEPLKSGEPGWRPYFMCQRATGNKKCGLRQVVIAQWKVEDAAITAVTNDARNAISLAEALVRADDAAGGYNVDKQRTAILQRREVTERAMAKARQLYLKNEDSLETWQADKAMFAGEIAAIDAELAALPTAPDPKQFFLAAKFIDQIAEMLDGADDATLRHVFDRLGIVRVSVDGVTLDYREPFRTFFAPA